MPNLKDIIVFVGIVGSIASICVILTRDPALCLRMTLLGSLVTVVIWALLKMLKWRRERPESNGPLPLPPHPQEPKKPIYSILRAKPEDITWIADLEKSFYKKDAIPEAKLKEWFEANPSGFFLVFENDRRIGHLDILPMKTGDRTFQEFCSGKKREVDIPGTSIASATQKHNIQHLYVESVIIHPQAINRQAALTLLLDQFIRLIEGVARIEKVENVYAIAATKKGQDLLEHLGFEVERRSKKMKDKHPLYRVRLWLMAKRIKRVIGKLRSVEDQKILDELLRRAAKSGL